jgi:hypothetical protein
MTKTKDTGLDLSSLNSGSSSTSAKTPRQNSSKDSSGALQRFSPVISSRSPRSPRTIESSLYDLKKLNDSSIGNLCGALNFFAVSDLGEEAKKQVKLLCQDKKSVIGQILPKIKEPRHMANFINDGRKFFQLDDLRITPDYLVSLVNKILPQTDSISLPNICNGLAKFGVRKNNSNFDLSKLCEAINKTLLNEALKPQALANMINGLAQLEFTYSDLEGINSELLCSEINRTLALESLELRQVTNILNGLGKLGFKQNNNEIAEGDSELKDYESSEIDQENYSTNSSNFLNINSDLLNTALERTLKGNSDQRKSELVSLSNIFSGLNKLGFRYDDDSDQNIRSNKSGFKKVRKALEKTLKQVLSKGNLDMEALASFFNGVSQFGLRKNHLNIDSETLKNVVKKFLLEEGNPRRLSNMLNGLANLGFEKSDLSIDPEELKRAVDSVFRVDSFAEEWSSTNFPNICSGLLNLGFVDAKFESTLELLPGLLNLHRNILQDIEIRTFRAIARFELYHLKTLGRSCFGDEVLDLMNQKIASEQLKDDEKKQSEYSNKIFEVLKQGFQGSTASNLIEYRVSQEIPYRYKGVPILDTDIVLTKGRDVIYVEIDGPTHFIQNQDQVPQLDNKTKIRNELYRFIAQEEKDFDIVFIQISYLEISDKASSEEIMECFQRKVEEAKNELLVESLSAKVINSPKKVMHLSELEKIAQYSSLKNPNSLSSKNLKPRYNPPSSLVHKSAEGNSAAKLKNEIKGKIK